MSTLDRTESTQASPIDRGDLESLIQTRGWPCVSIYCPTTHAFSRADENRIQFKNLVSEADGSLEQSKLSGDERKAVMAPLHELAEDRSFWRTQALEGLAVFRSRDQMKVYRLLSPVPPISIVAESYHIRPVVRIVEDSARYFVLCVSNDNVALYWGNRHHLAPVELHPKVPRNMADALGEPARVTKTKRATFVPETSDQKHAQLTRYFHRLDDVLWKYHFERAALPVILAALPEYHGFFHQASHNKHLLPHGVERDPFKAIDADRLRELAWEALKPHRDGYLKTVLDHFNEAKTKGKACDDLPSVARSAVFGKLRLLMLDEDQHMGGRLDPGTGDVDLREIENPATDDVLDDIAEVVLRNNGQVLVLSRDEMPTAAPAAGIERY